MSSGFWSRRSLRLLGTLSTLACLACLASLAGCGGTGGDPGAAQETPKPPRGAPTQVDVCGLVPRRGPAPLPGGPLRPVGLEYEAAKVPTLSCELGRRFGVPVLSITLGIGPISGAVFDQAYGDTAGGDPVAVKRLGRSAYIRTEDGHKSVHILVHGSVLTLRSSLAPVHPITRDTLVRLARTAVSELPRNPRLPLTDAGRRCSRIPLGAVTAAVGAQPSLLSSLDGPRRALICSWASEPGAAVVRIVTAADQVAAYRKGSRSGAYRTVHLRGVGRHADVTAVSRRDQPGDLLVFRGRSSVAVVTVMPTPGFSNPAIATTPGEGRLATAVLSTLQE
jgi:hypothetical protein